MSDIVILTATYNRADKLPRLYESLKKQTLNKFEWLIVDDGSTDDTKELVFKMMEEGLVKINYVFQQNGGKARALNNGFSQADHARVFAVVDSDDFLLPLAVESIQIYLDKYEHHEDIGAFFFYYNNLEGEVLKPNGVLIDNDKIMTRYEYNNVYKQNDGCICYLKKAVKEYKYPQFNNEKYVGPTVIQLKMAEKYKIVFSPKVIGVADYLEGGLTRSGRKLRLKNPMGMLSYSLLMMDKRSKLTTQLKYSISIWPYAQIANKSFIEMIKETKRPFLLLLTYFPGCLLSLYWRKYANK